MKYDPSFPGTVAAAELAGFLYGSLAVEIPELHLAWLPRTRENRGNDPFTPDHVERARAKHHATADHPVFAHRDLLERGGEWRPKIHANDFSNGIPVLGVATTEDLPEDLPILGHPGTQTRMPSRTIRGMAHGHGQVPHDTEHTLEQDLRIWEGRVFWDIGSRRDQDPVPGTPGDADRPTHDITPDEEADRPESWSGRAGYREDRDDRDEGEKSDLDELIAMSRGPVWTR